MRSAVRGVGAVRGLTAGSGAAGAGVALRSVPILPAFSFPAGQDWEASGRPQVGVPTPIGHRGGVCRAGCGSGGPGCGAERGFVVSAAWADVCVEM